MDFAQVENKYEELKRKYDAGAIPEDEFKAQLEELMIEDEEGKWWIIGYETGMWHYHDGEKWVRGEPPRVARPPARPPMPGIQWSWQNYRDCAGDCCCRCGRIPTDQERLSAYARAN
ncbi:MAG: hypothetical protein ACE5I2_12185 [Anaerolineae bacterium]